MIKPPINPALDALWKFGQGKVLQGGDTEAYNRMLGERADERTRQTRAAEDEQLFTHPDAQQMYMNNVNRSASDAASNGFARQWKPFFESFNLLGDETGKTPHVNTGSLHLPQAPAPSAPAGSVGAPAATAPVAGLQQAGQPSHANEQELRARRARMLNQEAPQANRTPYAGI